MESYANEVEEIREFYDQKYQELRDQDYWHPLRNEIDRLSMINQDLKKQIKEAYAESAFSRTLCMEHSGNQQSTISKLKKENTELQIKVEVLSSEGTISDLEARLQDRTKAFEELQKEFLAYKKISTPLRSISNLLFENEQLTFKCSELRDANQTLSVENERLRKDIERASKEDQATIGAMEAEMKTLRQFEADLLSNIKSKDSKIHILEDTVDRLTAQNKALEEKYKENESSKASFEKFHSEISALKSELNQKSFEISSLERELDNFQQKKSSEILSLHTQIQYLELLKSQNNRALQMFSFTDEDSTFNVWQIMKHYKYMMKKATQKKVRASKMNMVMDKVASDAVVRALWICRYLNPNFKLIEITVQLLEEKKLILEDTENKRRK